MLRAVRPNIGLEVEYRRRLVKLVEQMDKSVAYWVGVAYGQNTPAIAQDATPANILKAAIRKLRKRWLSDFDDLADDMANWFAKSVSKRSDAVMKAALRKGGFSVRFTMTAAQRDIIDATVNQNVALIKSIPQKYLSEVEGLVMRSVQVGGDLQQLTRALQKQFGVTRRRATLIARDQNIKATSALNRARQKELGIKKAIWMHSGAGKEPRPSHVKMNGKAYDVSKGMWDPDERRYVFPGELINCRCTSRSVVPGFD